jgi:hypothetical protein
MLRNFFRSILPYGFVEWNRRRRSTARQSNPNDWLDARRTDQSRNRVRIAKTYHDHSRAPKSVLNALSYDDVVDFLIARGVDRDHILEGSIPRTSLRTIGEAIDSWLDSSAPLRGLHIGNFVGVSLSFMTAAMVRRHPHSGVIGVDPNLPHRGVHNPQNHVAALLNACGLSSQVLLVAGYSQGKSVSNDGVVFGGYDPHSAYTHEQSCENVLELLCNLGFGQLDIAVIDGNHEAEYLKQEIIQVSKLLRTGGLLVVDDIDDAWEDLRDVFTEIGGFGFEQLLTDGRIGIARRMT